jgi:hypothetical protein
MCAIVEGKCLSSKLRFIWQILKLSPLSVREEKKFFIIAHDEGHCKGKKRLRKNLKGRKREKCQGNEVELCSKRNFYENLHSLKALERFP